MNSRNSILKCVLVASGLLSAIGGWFVFRLPPDETLARRLVAVPPLRDVALPTAPISPAAFVGDRICAECHQDLYQTFRQTTHARTSATADRQAIADELPANPHRVTLRDPELQMELAAGNDGVFQTAIAVVDASRFSHTERMDVTVGSGKLGHTFGYWKGSQLFQLPLSYQAATREWLNSPGFPDEVAYFARPMPSRCLECHAAYVAGDRDDHYVLYRTSVIYGVACELCHGAGKPHVDYHKAHPQAAEPQFIVQPGGLPRDRQIDVCSRCHGGGDVDDLLQPPFAFQPGDRIDSYVKKKPADEVAKMAPHSNDQALRLSRSRCFQSSTTLVCTTCHNPHEFERGNLKLFSNRCQQCHQPQDCGQFAELGSLIRFNCIDCHMRKAEIELHSRGFFANVADQEATKMRDHFIRKFDDSETSLRAALAPQALAVLKQAEADVAVDANGQITRVRWPKLFSASELVLLRTLAKLDELDVSELAIDNKSIATISQLKTLRRLVLAGTNMTNDDLRRIAGLTRLRSLDVSNCSQISDEGLAALTSLALVEFINLRGTAVTDAGVERLRAALPDCIVEK